MIMKRVEEHPPQNMVILYRVLLCTAAVLVFILIAGTIYGFVKRGKSPEAVPEAAGGESLFSGLGTMRIPTADPEPETLVISIAFPYNKNDRPFSEELASRLTWFKSSTTEYLGAFSAQELTALSTDTINQELLNRYNSVLKLGQIKEIYILEYMRL
ncbi:flagellar basal body protein FliL [Spirochaetia bacterium]|nr:flagellar basal body protein FliL [Spirochaetia bacterium]